MRFLETGRGFDAMILGSFKAVRCMFEIPKVHNFGESLVEC
jgi:hypothetical protein